MNELQILDAIQNMRTPALDAFMRFITRLGDAGIVWIILALALLLVRRTRKIGVGLAAALVFDVILCDGIIKNIVRRPRPCDVNASVQLLIERPFGFSFPSGHAAASFAAVSSLAFQSKKLALWLPALLLAVLISFSRMYLYVHYPTDILGGIAVGSLCGALSAILMRTELMRTKICARLIRGRDET